MCVALCWLASAVASAQVSVVCHTPADEELARTLARLIGQPVAAVTAGGDGAAAPEQEARTGEWVSIDRARATVVVHSVERQATLSRALGADVVNGSTYAVALAAAELLEWIESSPRDRDGTRAYARRKPHRSGALGVGVGADLELQTQPGYPLTLVRPALSVELAWGRQAGAGFWSLGVRAALPGHRSLSVDAPVPADLSALGYDGALQLTLGQTLGQLALTAQVAAGASYLKVEARDSEDGLLGAADEHVSPLFAAGIGFRYSVLFGFAFAVRAEALWVGRGTDYNIAGQRVLQAGALRIGLLAGILWESALAL